jgi:hypothetical protein
MTTDLDKMKSIYDAIDRIGKSLRVSFNYRYAPAYTRFRDLVMEGAVGRPLAVDFSWILDTSHGADYFRRRHREKQNNGAYPSIPARHDDWRRASADWLAGLVVRQIIDEPHAAQMVADLAYNLAKKTYKLGN